MIKGWRNILVNKLDSLAEETAGGNYEIVEIDYELLNLETDGIKCEVKYTLIDETLQIYKYVTIKVNSFLEETVRYRIFNTINILVAEGEFDVVE